MNADFATSQNTTATHRVIEEMAMHATRPMTGEEDHRPLPDAEQVVNALDDVFGIFAEVIGDSRLEEYLSPILSDLVNSFQRRVIDIERNLDTNEFQQRELIDSFDGSEIKTTQLEDLQAVGKTLLEARNAFETIRDIAADQFEITVGNAWLPNSRKSVVNHAARSQAVIDSRDFIRARQNEKTVMHIPEGAPVLFSGGFEETDIDGINLVLDRIHAKTPEMFLVTTGGNRGADVAAAAWAKSRKVACVTFGLTKKGKSAPFERNREIFKQLTPVYTVVFGGGGIQENLAELSKGAGVRAYKGAALVAKFRSEGGEGA